MLNKVYARYLMATNIPRMFEKIQTRKWCKEMFDQWIKHLNIQQNDKVLDVGCGPGVLTKYLAETGADATGLDQSEGMISLASQKNNIFSEKADFRVGDALNLPFRDSQFNFSIAASLINIISSPDKALHEMLRCVKVGGSISFLIPSLKMNVLNAQSYCKTNNIRGLEAALLELWASNAICLSIEEAEGYAQKIGIENITVHKYLDEMVISVTGIKPE